MPALLYLLLGYHYKGLDEAVKNQVDKLIHTSNLFYNVPALEAAEKLKKAAGMDRVFFTNSGTEAIEGAINWRKINVNKDHGHDHEIIAHETFFSWKKYGSFVGDWK